MSQFEQTPEQKQAVEEAVKKGFNDTDASKKFSVCQRCQGTGTISTNSGSTYQEGRVISPCPDCTKRR